MIRIILIAIACVMLSATADAATTRHRSSPSAGRVYRAYTPDLSPAMRYGGYRARVDRSLYLRGVPASSPWRRQYSQTRRIYRSYSW